MNFINFQSAREKEKIREELKKVKEELLQKSKVDAERKIDREIKKKLRGEDNWILPDVEKKLMKSSKTEKKHKKKLKKKSEKSHKKKKSSKKNSSDEDSSEVEKIPKKKRKRKFSTESSSSSSSSEEEWVVKESNVANVPTVREDWMSGGLLLPTYSKNKDQQKEEKPNIDKYDPKQSSRELNPYWKNGGTGLPEFRKPVEDEKNYNKHLDFPPKNHGRGNWRKNPTKNETNDDYLKQSNERIKDSEYQRNSTSNYVKELKSSSSSESEDEKSEKNKEPSSNFLTDQQMNELGAQIIKAEIMNNGELVKTLREKLENARKVRNQIKDEIKLNPDKNFKNKPNTQMTQEKLLLSRTNSKGDSRPLTKPNYKQNDPWGGRNCKSKKVETHTGGERVRYFPDDDRFDIKQMFEREKYESAMDSDLQFAEIAGKHKNPKDDLEDIFEDKIRKNISEHKEADKEKQRAINEHNQLNKMLDNCDKCFNSHKMEKQLMVSMGTTCYLSVPWHEGIQTGQCLIVPMQHVSCSTQLDEDVWSEITEYRRALVRMFESMKKDVIFFEIARLLHRRPHMVIHCIASSKFEMAPFYFKKAIQESEYEWSTNKQLITLKEKDIRRSIPKGLPYFWVHFGMDSGFAHVIEDQEKFPSNFAEEIIGGMLELNPRVWRKPRKEHNSIAKVKQLADWWKPFDFTK